MLRPPEDLSPECRAFQRHYDGGRSHQHLATCPDCRRFAEFVDGLRGLGLSSPLGDALRERLRGVPESTEPVPAFPRVPELPLPAPLRRRLRDIARRGATELPIWIRSPRYAIAASYLLTILIGATLGNPAAWAGEATSRLETVGSAWNEVHRNGRETFRGIGETANEGFVVTRDYLRASGSALRARWTELVDSIAEPDTTDNGSTDGGTADEPHSPSSD